MVTKQLILAGCAAMILTVGTAQAGPCNTTGTATNLRSGAGTPSGDTGTMNRATEEVATMEGQPRPAQPGQDAEPSAKMTDKDQPTPSRQTQSPEPSEKMADQGC
jgi:hypothetical protein